MDGDSLFIESFSEEDILKLPTNPDDIVHLEENDDSFIVPTQLDNAQFEAFLHGRVWIIIQMVLYALAFVLIFTANVLLLLTIRRVPYLKTTLNRYVASLSVCDIVIGLYSLLQLLSLVVPVLQKSVVYCVGLELGWICLSIVAQLMVLFVAFDCYFSIWHPISYSGAVAPWKASVAIFLAWIYSGAVSLVPLLWFIDWTSTICYVEHLLHTNYVIFLLVHYAVAVIIVVVVYLCVYHEIRTKQVIFNVYQQRNRQRQVYEDRRKRDAQNANCMAIMSLVFVIFWLPYYFLLAVHVFVVRLYLTNILEVLVLLLCIFHSSVNPVIYLCKIEMFHIACYKVLCCCQGQEFPSRPPSDNIQLHSMSFRNHVTGSMMSLHTTLSGKLVRLPQQRIPTAAEGSNDIWVTPETSTQRTTATAMVHRGASPSTMDLSHPGEIYHRN